MPRIFISYKRLDKEKVIKIKDQIESALGERCWIDLDGIESDAIFVNKIISAINKCDIFLFMYSKSHMRIVDYEKDWTIKELNYAQMNNKRIVFVNIDGSVLTDWFAMMFGLKQQVDGRDLKNINKLITDLSQWLNVQSNISDSGFYFRGTLDNRPQELVPSKWLWGIVICSIIAFLIYCYCTDSLTW